MVKFIIFDFHMVYEKNIQIKYENVQILSITMMMDSTLVLDY